MKEGKKIAVIGDRLAAGACLAHVVGKNGGAENYVNMDIHFFGREYFSLPNWNIVGNSLKLTDIEYPYRRLLSPKEELPVIENDRYDFLCDSFSIIQNLLNQAKDTLGSDFFHENSFIQKVDIEEGKDLSPRFFLQEDPDKIPFDSVILATGAQQKLSSFFTEHREKTYFSEPILRKGGEEVITDTLRDNPEADIVIAGGSHSAFSVLKKIERAIESETIDMPKNPIKILSTSPIRIFYETEAGAIADGYDYSPDHVCLQTGRVNRFGGVRAFSKAIAQRLLRGQLPWTELHISKPNSQEYRDKIQNAGIIIQSFGEQTRLPEFTREGEKVVLNNTRGLVDVSSESRNLLYQDTFIQGLYGLGIGFGLTPDTGFGEASFRGKLVTMNEYADTGVRSIFKNIFSR